MITDILKLLHSHHFMGAGQYTEIAKGKNEIDNYFRKIKRWLSQKKSQ